MLQHSQEHFFSDFTFAEFRKLIRVAKQNYIFRNFIDFNRDERYILWRHDVDFSMHAARKIAQIEHEEGIKSTFFLLLHSDFYNLFDKESRDCVREIISLGHEIGLHFDSFYYSITAENQLQKFLSREKRILEELFEHEIAVFSFHNTTPFTMNCKEWSYANMINVYADYFQKNVEYCSDSNGYWRFERLENVLVEAKPSCLQVLTHPVWWVSEPMSPRNRVLKCLSDHFERSLKKYDVGLQTMGRLNLE
jgi:hypothetical protein